LDSTQTPAKEHVVSRPADTEPAIRALARRQRDHGAPNPAGDGGQLLGSAVSYNAIISATSGLALVTAAPLLSGPIGLPGWILAVVGAGLVGFAALLLWLLAEPRRLALGVRFVLGADVVWVLGAVVLLVGSPTLLAPAGQVALGAVSVVVAVIAVGQAVGLQRRGAAPMTATSPVRLRVERVVAAPVERVWEAVSDAGDYGRFASGIEHTTIVTGEREGMVRLCRDDRGGEWTETCTLWEDGHRYRMTVDVASYPAYYRLLLRGFAQTWTVEPAPGGTRIRLAFDGAVKLGALGRAAVRVLGRRRRLEAILDNYERELTEGARTD
jgi:uncharacterized protein YndB with AHSA1/START domain